MGNTSSFEKSIAKQEEYVKTNERSWYESFKTWFLEMAMRNTRSAKLKVIYAKSITIHVNQIHMF